MKTHLCGEHSFRYEELSRMTVIGDSRTSVEVPEAIIALVLAQADGSVKTAKKMGIDLLKACVGVQLGHHPSGWELLQHWRTSANERDLWTAVALEIGRAQTLAAGIEDADEQCAESVEIIMAIRRTFETLRSEATRGPRLRDRRVAGKSVFDGKQHSRFAETNVSARHAGGSNPDKTSQ